MREALEGASRVLLVTGAGISAESGIPTFRGPGGWWRNLDPMRLATPEAFARDPGLVWEWYDHRRRAAAAAPPNAGHRALAALARPGREVVLVTQNVDDLHERAGSPSVLHVHGSLWTVRCTREGTLSPNREVPLPEIPPRCGCGALLRPHITWFGETIMGDAVAGVEEGLAEGFDAALVVGTEATFPYIVEWALRARRGGALLAEVNPVETALTPYADLSLRGKAGEVLPGVAGG
ncbi:MAG: NAD-dependent protein deacylase [Planctomycetes bacterium]|nr:NAD-dependent protein deacylase [Planctomycetota bacterium]